MTDLTKNSEEKPEARNDEERKMLKRKKSMKKLKFDHPGQKRFIEITWGRICAIVAVTINLSLEVTKQGNFDLVTPIIDSCVYMCKTEGVFKWIENKGGWNKLRLLATKTQLGFYRNDNYEKYKLNFMISNSYFSLTVLTAVFMLLIFVLSKIL